MKIIKRKPTHPGQILKEDYIEPLGITITYLSEVLGVSRKTLSKIINEKASVTPEMALKLSRAFNTSPEFWLNLQRNYDLWIATQETEGWKTIEPLVETSVYQTA
ncbi:HigA protein (antitoxin to HigB) [Dissulfuribacter thermophilus]|uniref:HigA protein (Antitoxin to HigB) n=1 Tax=Dissulfuribacter thermophilus TaxID=1156395 RepID=A0A1B9F2J0_9BACT|nr:HigA family addiction module antitoxin [Dissulfuribacter thermophilus]OCC14142.1 HigA protein (antitoxin to HigB) [Dissulfuribacter thermophilus]